MLRRCSGRRSRGIDAVQRVLKIADRIHWILQSRIESDQPITVYARVRGLSQIRSDHQAGYTAPAVPQTEEREAIHERMQAGLCQRRSKDDRKETSRSREVPLPDGMVRARSKSGVEYDLDLRSFDEPVGHPKRRLLDCI